MKADLRPTTLRTTPETVQTTAQGHAHAGQESPEELLRTFKAQSQLLHSLEANGALDDEGRQLMPSIDEAVSFLEDVIAGGGS